MKQSCQLAADTLLLVGEHIKPGVSTHELDMIAHEYIVNNNAYPSPLNYKGFPKSICTSINSVACHGIPNKRDVLKNGDIINVDISTFYPEDNGFHGDTSAMFFVGQVSEQAKLLVETTREALERAIKIVKPGISVGHIGYEIESFITSKGFQVVKEFVGHGVGREFHSAPSIFHFGKPGMGAILQEGMIFTIEPIVNCNSDRCFLMPDGWTVVAAEGNLSAQFEHTVLVTKEGCEVLTIRSKPLKNSEVF